MTIDSVLNLVPDIHFEKKMGCVDCHTAQETMGDGKIYGRMKDQLKSGVKIATVDTRKPL